MNDKIALQITVRRIKTSPGYEVNISKMPNNPVEFAALLSFVKMACEKTINDFLASHDFAFMQDKREARNAHDTGFSAAIKK